MFPLALATIAFAFYSDIAMTALQSRIVLRGARVVQRGVPVGEGPRNSLGVSAPIRAPAGSLLPDVRPTAIDSERPFLCNAAGKFKIRRLGSACVHSRYRTISCGARTGRLRL